MLARPAPQYPSRRRILGAAWPLTRVRSFFPHLAALVLDPDREPAATFNKYELALSHDTKGTHSHALPFSPLIVARSMHARTSLCHVEMCLARATISPGRQRALALLDEVSRLLARGSLTSFTHNLCSVQIVER